MAIDWKELRQDRVNRVSMIVILLLFAFIILK